MQAGRLKHRLEAYRPSEVQDAFGGTSQGFELYKMIRAERVKMTVFKSDEIGEHFADSRAEFNIRDSHPVADTWRVKDLCGYEYTVVAVLHNVDRGMKTLVCERLNT